MNDKVWCKAHRVYCEHARPDSRCTTAQCVLVLERKPNKWEIIERNRARFCLNHCPFVNSECKDCYYSQQPKDFRRLMAEKAVEAGFKPSEAADMFGIKEDGA